MEPDTRLADYLDDLLGTDERAEVDEALSRDADLRARLDAMRRADVALASERSPEPSEGFRGRLTEQLEPAVTARIARDAARQAWHGGGGPRRRSLPTLVAAAALVAVVAIGFGISTWTGPGGTSDDMHAADAPVDAPADDALTAESFRAEAVPGLDGPVIVSGDRVIDDAPASVLELDPMVLMADAGLARPEAEAIARDWRDRIIGAAPGEETSGADAPAATLEMESGIASTQPELDGGTPDGVRQCLVEVLDTEPMPIPVYVETARGADDEPVLVFGLVSLDPVTSAYTRREVWIVDADGCHPRAFAQG